MIDAMRSGPDGTGGDDPNPRIIERGTWLHARPVDSPPRPVTAQEALTRDLYIHLVELFYSVPRPRRQRSRWVMNREWYDECAKIGGWPEPGVTTMLGLPFTVTEDGGFPHLVEDLYFPRLPEAPDR